jgi:hypothetical protein
MTLVRSDHRIHRLIGLQQWLFLLGFGTSVLFYRILGIQERRLEGIVGVLVSQRPWSPMPPETTILKVNNAPAAALVHQFVRAFSRTRTQSAAADGTRTPTRIDPV